MFNGNNHHLDLGFCRMLYIKMGAVERNQAMGSQVDKTSEKDMVFIVRPGILNNAQFRRDWG